MIHFDSIKHQFYLRKQFLSKPPELFAVRIPGDYVQLAADGKNFVNIRIPLTFIDGARARLSLDNEPEDTEMVVVKIGSNGKDIWSSPIHGGDNEMLALEIVRITFGGEDVQLTKLMPFVIVGVILLIIGVIVFSVMMISPTKTDKQRQETESVV